MTALLQARKASPSATSNLSPLPDLPGQAAVRAAGAWREPPALTLDERGVILDCSERGEEFFGYTRAELACQHVSKVLPQLSGLALLEDGEPNAYITYLCHIGHAFEVTPRGGIAFLCGLSLVRLSDAGHTFLRLIAQSSPAVIA